MNSVSYENEIIKAFQSTTNSYKYYWWLSILQLIKGKEKQVFMFDEIVLQMIVLAWYPVNFYKISLGKQDQLALYIKEIKSHFENLNDDIKEEELLLFLTLNKEHYLIKGIINKLVRYVPYRFIRPWFNEIISYEDAKVNNQIGLFQNNSNKQVPYKIKRETKEIFFNLNWYEWIYSNLKLLEAFTLYELFKYIEKNNSYITNISLKLFRPKVRKLTEAIKLWKNFIKSEGGKFNSIFENKPLIELNKLSIDHYLPWSLVTHDKLWNLHPIEQNVNSLKNNKIAHIKYLINFANLQYWFIHYIATIDSKYLEDYIILFSVGKNELLNIERYKFIELLSEKITIETELAANLGYYTKWSYLIQE